jgi:hypothetical protein
MPMWSIPMAQIERASGDLVNLRQHLPHPITGAPALGAILVDSYLDTDESGCRFDKAAILGALKSGDLKLTSITLLETHVHRYGNSAVLTGVSEQTGAFQDHRTERYFSPPPWF